MSTAAWVLLAMASWIVVSALLGPLVGRFVKIGRGGRE